MRLSAFILVGRKEKAGNTSRSFHRAHCFNVGEGRNSTCPNQSVFTVNASEVSVRL